MSVLRLRLRRAPEGRLDLSALDGAALARHSLDELAALELCCGRSRQSLSTWFELEQEPQDGGAEPTVEIHDSHRWLDGIGTGLHSGRIEVFGDAGAFTGENMQGGFIHVHGNCGAYAGTAMTGGTLRISGHAGDLLAAPRPGVRAGMRGGEIVVQGNAGDRAGEQMRRGTVLVGGDCGRSCGARMIAGTLVVRGSAGAGVGRGMRRGTLLLGALGADPPATFAAGGVQTLNVLSLLERHLASLAQLPAPAPAMAAQRWIGDRANGGLGEILVPVRD